MEVFSPVRKQAHREVWLSSSHRPVSDLPPVASSKERAAANGSSNGHAATNGSGPADPEEPTVLPPVDEGRVE
jgi:cell division protease FtsH